MKIILVMLIASCTNFNLICKNKLIDENKKIIEMRKGDELALKQVADYYGEINGFTSKEYKHISTIGLIVTEFTTTNKEETEKIIINGVKDYIKHDPLSTDQDDKTTLHRIIEKDFRELFKLYVQEKGTQGLIRSEKSKIYKYIYNAIDLENDYFITEIFNTFYKDNEKNKDELLCSPLEYALLRNKCKAVRILINIGDEIRWSGYSKDSYGLFLSKVPKDLKKYILRSQLDKSKNLEKLYNEMRYKISTTETRQNDNPKEGYLNHFREHFCKIKFVKFISIDIDESILKEEKESLVEMMDNIIGEKRAKIEEDKYNGSKKIEIEATEPKAKSKVKALRDCLKLFSKNRI